MKNLIQGIKAYYPLKEYMYLNLLNDQKDDTLSYTYSKALIFYLIVQIHAPSILKLPLTLLLINQSIIFF